MSYKLPLILDMKPILNRLGPVVYLEEGTWEISSDIKDSQFELISQGLPSVDSADLNQIPGPKVPLVNGMVIKGGLRQVLCIKVGTEKGITIFAVKKIKEINGN